MHSSEIAQCSEVSPGPIDTPLASRQPPDVIARIVASGIWGMDGGVHGWVANCSTTPTRDEAAHEWAPSMTLSALSRDTKRWRALRLVFHLKESFLFPS